MASTRERLLALHRAEPHLNQTQIAERLGVTRQRIGQLIEALERDGELTTDEIDRGPRGIRGRPKASAAAEAAPRVTGGIVAIPAAATPAVAVLLVAADLTARGYSVFAPLTPSTAKCDLVAIDRDDRVERIVVSRGRRAGEEIRYDDPQRYGGDRRAMLLTDEPIQYEPPLESAESGYRSLAGRGRVVKD